jgi:hypothetical protein
MKREGDVNEIGVLGSFFDWLTHGWWSRAILRDPNPPPPPTQEQINDG